MPERIQRRRTAGWRMPEGAIYVGRGAKWGNPYRVTRGFGKSWNVYYHTVSGSVRVNVNSLSRDGAQLLAVQQHRIHVKAASRLYTRMLDELRGHDLACWCPLDQPCHADVLLELANG